MTLPLAWLEGQRFTMVHPDLVRALGGNIAAAAVLGRLHFRLHGPEAYHEGDHTWVRLSQTEIGDEIGLSRDQVKRALNVLVEAGYLLAEEHRLGGVSDRTNSYAIDYETPSPLDDADAPSRVGESAQSRVGESAQSSFLLRSKEEEPARGRPPTAADLAREQERRHLRRLR